MSEGIDWLNDLNLFKGKRILCLVDGEHYPPVTEWAVKAIEEKGGNIAGLIFIGGTEKIGTDIDKLFSTVAYSVYTGNPEGGIPLYLISKAVKEQSPDIVIDLSDDPVADYRKRFRIASVLLHHEIIYAGADFVFRPPANYDVLTKPAITIFGMGKRIGKTAVSITVARALRRHGITSAVVAMGRGGPSEPEIVDTDKVNLTPDYLLEVARKGRHAASDYLENAVLSGVPAVGCRRCGGGLAGNPFISNVREGARKANDLPVDLIIMEGSGPTLPPVKTNRKIVVVGANQPLDYISGFFGTYRLLNSDLVIVTMCEEPIASEPKIEAILYSIKQANPDVDVIQTVFHPEPLGNIKGKKVFLATTAPASIIERIKRFLEQKYECKISGYSTNLSNRTALKEDLKNGLDSAEVLLTEIKAASIDIAAKAAKKQGMEIIFLHNRATPVAGTGLDEAILHIWGKVKNPNL